MNAMRTRARRDRAGSDWEEKRTFKYLTPPLLKCADVEWLVSLVAPRCVEIRAFICMCLFCPCVALTEGWLYHLRCVHVIV